MTCAAAAVLALPFVVTPLVTILRMRHSRALNQEDGGVAPDAPLVSVIIPARNEARNIQRCVNSVLAASYPRLEVIAVDDHSSDGTGALLRDIAAADSRLSVVVPPPLPEGWFGKQWACDAGFRASRGDVVAFLDADTWQAPDLVPRAVNAMRSRDAELLSIVGSQVMESFWERLMQPQVFNMMLTRFGGSETVNSSPRASDKVANGQCIFFRRDSYVAMGGHEAVRGKVAEDMSLAQRWFAEGRRSFLVMGLEQLHTRMYASLAEIVRGWGKNIYAAGIESAPFGRLGRLLYPLMLLVPALGGVVPPVVLVLALSGVLGTCALLWSAVAFGANLLWWLAVHGWLRMSPAYGLLHPLGAAVLLYIALRAIVRGRRVEWKGRLYRVN